MQSEFDIFSSSGRMSSERGNPEMKSIHSLQNHSSLYELFDMDVENEKNDRAITLSNQQRQISHSGKEKNKQMIKRSDNNKMDHASSENFSTLSSLHNNLLIEGHYCLWVDQNRQKSQNQKCCMNCQQALQQKHNQCHNFCQNFHLMHQNKTELMIKRRTSCSCHYTKCMAVTDNGCSCRKNDLLCTPQCKCDKQCKNSSTSSTFLTSSTPQSNDTICLSSNSSVASSISHSVKFYPPNLLEDQ